MKQIHEQLVSDYCRRSEGERQISSNRYGKIEIPKKLFLQQYPNALDCERKRISRQYDRLTWFTVFVILLSMFALIFVC